MVKCVSVIGLDNILMTMAGLDDSSLPDDYDDDEIAYFSVR